MDFGVVIVFRCMGLLGLAASLVQAVGRGIDSIDLLLLEDVRIGE